MSTSASRVVPLLDRCVTLGREFGRREMHKHLKLLREFYAATRDQRDCVNSWSEAFVDNWLAMLRLAPFETTFELLPARSVCARCNADPAAVPSRRTETTFPGGALMRCDQCGRRWVEAWACC